MLKEWMMERAGCLNSRQKCAPTFETLNHSFFLHLFKDFDLKKKCLERKIKLKNLFLSISSIKSLDITKKCSWIKSLSVSY